VRRTPRIQEGKRPGVEGRPDEKGLAWGFVWKGALMEIQSFLFFSDISGHIKVSFFRGRKPAHLRAPLSQTLVGMRGGGGANWLRIESHRVKVPEHALCGFFRGLIPRPGSSGIFAMGAELSGQ